jgi:protein TonB
MDFARQQRDPARHVIGITFVILMHAVLIYLLVTGLGRTVVEVIKKPLTATIIEEIKAPPPPPPPPPPKRIVEPPKIQQPEPYVPPPDIPAPTPPAEPVISAPATTPPSQSYTIAPPAPVEAPPPPKPSVRKGIVRLSGDDPAYPRQAIRAGVEKGHVLARVMIDEKGNVTDVIIVSQDPPRVFERAVIDALKEWKFKAEGEKYVGEVEINFKLQ